MQDILQNNLGFTFLWDSLNRKTKKELIQILIANLEITRDKNYNMEHIPKCLKKVFHKPPLLNYNYPKLLLF